MAEQSEPAQAAAEAKQNVLSARQRTAAEADAALSDVLGDAHTAAVEGRARVDEIAAQIEDWVADQNAFAVDTPMGARELQRLLLSKQRELADVVAEAYRDDADRQAKLNALYARYRDPAGES